MDWISVEDRLPDIGCGVLVVIAGRVRPAFRRETKFHKRPESVSAWKDMGGYALSAPTHWMPYPEPPK